MKNLVSFQLKIALGIVFYISLQEVYKNIFLCILKLVAIQMAKLSRFTCPALYSQSDIWKPKKTAYTRYDSVTVFMNEFLIILNNMN